MGLKALAIKGTMQLKKYSPELCLAAGIGCFVGAVISGSKATLKCQQIKADHIAKREEIEEVRNNEEFAEEYTDLDYKKDVATVYLQTGVAYAKNYALTAGLMAAGIFFVLGSYKIMKTRYAMISASYSALQKMFNIYRERVRNDAGADKDVEYMYGAKKQEIATEVTDENGKTKKVKEQAFVFEGKQFSKYARFFDESCEQWTKDPAYNLDFLIRMQQVANERLHAKSTENGKGFVVLNEIYEILGIPQTSDGAQVGWVEGNGDGYIDFGIHTGFVQNRNFVNGYERVILLDFNVDGYILDKI